MRGDDCIRSNDLRPRVSVPDQLPSHRGPPPLFLPDRLTIQQVLQDGEKDLEDYCTEIDCLQQKKSSLDQYLNHYRSLVAPVWKLPYELLVIVFADVCEGAAYLNGGGYGDTRKRLPQLELGAVCSHWRRSTPAYWSDIYISFTKNGIPEPSLVQLFLALSMENLLALTMEFDCGDNASQLQGNIGNPACQALAKQSHRWKVLDLAGAASEDADILRPHVIKACPELKRLSLFGFEDPDELDKFVLDFVPMPKLISFDAHVTYPVTGPDYFPWHQLDHLSASGSVDLSRCLPLCRDLSFLQLYLDHSLEYYEDSSVVHKGLTSLKLTLHAECTGEQATVYLASLTFPSLTSLSIVCSNPDEAVLWPSPMTDSMTSFIRRCSCSLTKLFVADIFVHDFDLIMFLNETPTLVHLEIKEPALSGDDVGFSPFPLTVHLFRSLHIEALLPRLESLLLTVHKRFAQTAFVRMVASRRLGLDSGVVPLKEVSVCLGGKNLPVLERPVDLNKLEPLRALKADDFSLKIVIFGEEIVFS